MIDLKTIEKLAELSRISVSNEEKETLFKDIGSILSYVDQIKMVAGEADVAAKREENELKNIFREDGNYHDRGQFTEALLECAPKKENSCIMVKKIL